MKATIRENTKLKSQLSTNTRPTSLSAVEQQLKSVDHEIINLQNKLNDNPSLDFRRSYQLRLQHMKKLRADLNKNKHQNNVSINHQSKTSIKHTYKKPKDDVAYTAIVNYIQQAKSKGDVTLTLEDTANNTNIHPNIIKKIFIRLNREGLLSQRVNRKHEDFDWIASYYIIQ